VRTRQQRNADLKLIAAATVAVLLAGGLIAAGLIIVTSDSTKAHCGRLPIGSAEQIRSDLEGGPQFQTGGGPCGFWLALDGGDVVAYKADQPSGCVLQPRNKVFRCGGETPAVEDLATYPVSIEQIDDVDTVIVDLNPPGAVTSTRG
jgi:hypothetical protein